MKQYNEHWLKMMGFSSQEEAREEMSKRGQKGKGIPKSYNKLRDEEGYAKELRAKSSGRSKKGEGQEG